MKELDQMGIGMGGHLVDEDGFPHVHIDLYVVRLLRADIRSTSAFMAHL